MNETIVKFAFSFEIDIITIFNSKIIRRKSTIILDILIGPFCNQQFSDHVKALTINDIKIKNTKT